MSVIDERTPYWILWSVVASAVTHEENPWQRAPLAQRPDASVGIDPSHTNEKQIPTSIS